LPAGIRSKKFIRSALAQGVGWNLTDRFPTPTLKLAPMGLSPFYLARSFTKHVGLPPHAYKIHVRVERGRALLRTGATPAETASHVGFANQSHFTRQLPAGFADPRPVTVR
jgi:AraC-like DNA-binding protein